MHSGKTCFLNFILHFFFACDVWADIKCRMRDRDQTPDQGGTYHRGDKSTEKRKIQWPSGLPDVRSDPDPRLPGYRAGGFGSGLRRPPQSGFF